MGRLTILVCGATGRLGQLTAVLRERGHQVLAATRDPRSAGARATLLSRLVPNHKDARDRGQLVVAQ